MMSSAQLHSSLIYQLFCFKTNAYILLLIIDARHSSVQIVYRQALQSQRRYRLIRAADYNRQDAGAPCLL